MNMLMVDATDDPSVVLGTEVEIFGPNIPLPLFASWTKSDPTLVTVTVGKARNDDLMWELQCWASGVDCPEEQRPLECAPRQDGSTPDEFSDSTRTVAILELTFGAVGGLFFGVTLAGLVFWRLHRSRGAYTQLP
jgi:hypothetical protein